MAKYRQAGSWTTCRGTTTTIERKVEVMNEKLWTEDAPWLQLRRCIEDAFADEMESLTNPAHDALDEMERRYKDAYREGHEAGYNEALLEAATHQGITDEANNESCTIRDMLGLISAHAQDCGVSAMVSVCLDELDAMRDRAYENGYNDGRRDERLEAHE